MRTAAVVRRLCCLASKSRMRWSLIAASLSCNLCYQWIVITRPSHSVLESRHKREGAIEYIPAIIAHDEFKAHGERILLCHLSRLALLLCHRSHKHGYINIPAILDCAIRNNTLFGRSFNTFRFIPTHKPHELHGTEYTLKRVYNTGSV